MKEDYDKSRKTVREQNMMSELERKNTSEACNYLRQMLDNAVKKFIPKCSNGIPAQQRKPVWWNDKALTKIKEKKQITKDASSPEKPKNLLSMQKLGFKQKLVS